MPLPPAVFSKCLRQPAPLFVFVGKACCVALLCVMYHIFMALLYIVYRIFAALAKNSRERGLARPGCGFGRMLRRLWHPAQEAGAQPSGTDSFRRTAGSGQGAATVHSQNVTAGCLRLLSILELTQPGVPIPFPGVPPHPYKTQHNSFLVSPTRI